MSQPSKYDEGKKKFGTALRYLRIKKGLSHHELADRVGVRQSLIKEWEEERATPTVVQFKKICGTLPMVRHFANTLPLGYDVLARDMIENYGHTPIHSQADLDREERELKEELRQLKTNTFSNTFGGMLKYCRLELGSSQDELGDAVGVTGQSVSAWEADLASPVRENYDKLIGMFPKLKEAPVPQMLNRPMPDGGKGQPKPKTSTWRDKVLAAIGMAPPEFRNMASVLKREVEGEIGAKQFQEELDGLINWAKSLKQLLPVHVPAHDRHWPGNGESEHVVAPTMPPVPTTTPVSHERPATVFIPVLPKKLDYEPIPLPEGLGLGGAGARYATALANLEKAQSLKEGTKVLFDEASVYYDIAQETVTVHHQQLLDEAKKGQG